MGVHRVSTTAALKASPPVKPFIRQPCPHVGEPSDHGNRGAECRLVPKRTECGNLTPWSLSIESMETAHLNYGWNGLAAAALLSRSHSFIFSRVQPGYGRGSFSSSLASALNLQGKAVNPPRPDRRRYERNSLIRYNTENKHMMAVRICISAKNGLFL
jgi:hypothetical protein